MYRSVSFSDFVFGSGYNGAVYVIFGVGNSKKMHKKIETVW